MKRLFAYLQLLRLPNVFTAMADVSMGFLISHGSLEPWTHFVPLLAASACIYLAGIVLNDWFDIEVDRAERPERPLPSDRIPRAHALFLGVALLGGGAAAAIALGAATRRMGPVNVTVLLVAAVLLYDGSLKHTLFGPATMGLCRALNVLLGMSDVPSAIWLFKTDLPLAWRLGTMAATGVGLYIMGVTRFARSEIAPDARPTMLSTALGFNLGLLMIAMIPPITGGPAGPAPGPSAPYWLRIRFEEGVAGSSATERFYFAASLWLMVGLITNIFVARALADRQPSKVQQAVKACIVLVIGLDAAVVAFVNGPVWACAGLALLVPTLLVGRWVYST